MRGRGHVEGLLLRSRTGLGTANSVKLGTIGKILRHSGLGARAFVGVQKLELCAIVYRRTSVQVLVKGFSFLQTLKMSDYNSFFGDDDTPAWLTASKEDMPTPVDQAFAPIFGLDGSAGHCGSSSVKREELQASHQRTTSRFGVDRRSG
ncbi:hypothetical protein AXG93_684s1010 [Marchantia polymorpha subsp. ruderalis]|uniref:Uncharacterized protein n=1 Tax=Marchantia polymorpha subsp. ruderalis TaxID=1480154 RepID=A0A176W843_MARPO|nr:hypothetical protein AXG93_684s1010 [Marchantia polymorpha subsp. ruderalis]